MIPPEAGLLSAIFFDARRRACLESPSLHAFLLFLFDRLPPWRSQEVDMAGWRFPIGIAIVAFSVAAAGVVSGQTTFGMIGGRITDSTGAVLPGATVTVTNIRTGDKRVVVTNEQ